MNGPRRGGRALLRLPLLLGAGLLTFGISAVGDVARIVVQRRDRGDQLSDQMYGGAEIERHRPPLAGGEQVGKPDAFDRIGDDGERRRRVVESIDAADAADTITRELGGVDASLVFAARISAFELGFRLLRKRGLFVGVGIPPDRDGSFQLSPMAMFFKDVTIVYSAIGTVQDMRDVVDLADAGVLRSHVSRTGPLSELDEVTAVRWDE